MTEDITWRIKGNEPWGAMGFKTAVQDVLYREHKDVDRSGCTFQQLAFAHMVLDCHINKRSRPARTTPASKGMRTIEPS
ncbi:hypothetical protein CBR_g53617 [Chara braunii]|uniref:Uncharacterized protein n=1 Tax=Chara braunii TaxID=69332 RepID=A0A388MB16_CHABU|nr:hypothetical protein CBR_g53617 [Chara braunii]|eukprot:GBG91764.1 hypothetical protein CBR_g53617 [Chara braunii]